MSSDFDRSVFHKMICNHLADRQVLSKDALNALQTFDFDNTDDYDIVSVDNTEKFKLSNYDDVFIYSQSVQDSDMITSTYYTLDDKSEKRSVYVYQDRLYTKADLQSSIEDIDIQLPELLCKIFWCEYGGDDDGIATSNGPIFIRKADADLAKRIVSGDINPINPIIYVSSRIDSSLHDIDCEKIANALAGQAHVVVEGSPAVSEKVVQLTKNLNKQKPYNGFIHIYGSDRVSEQPNDYVDTDSTTDEIIAAVQAAQRHIACDEKYNAAHIRQAHALSKLGADNELGQIFESMLADKQQEIESLRSELASVKKNMLDARNKASTLEAKFEQKMDSDTDKCVSLKITENNLYDGEIATFIINALKKEFDSIKDDPVLNKSRRYDVLSDILDHNFPCTTGADLVRCLRDASKDGTLTREGIGYLQSSGFSVVKGSDHYKIYMGNETRYFVTLASTASDKRAYLNAVSDFSTKLFS